VALFCVHVTVFLWLYPSSHISRWTVVNAVTQSRNIMLRKCTIKTLMCGAVGIGRKSRDQQVARSYPSG